MSRKIPRNVLVLAFVALASGFGQDLITPILPGYLSLVGISAAGIGLIDGLLQGSTSVFRFVSGILSDRFHDRKRFVFLGYALSSVARPLLALAGSLVPVAILRTIDGVGKGMKDAPRDALVADSSAQEIHGRAFGFHRLVDTAGSVLGPAVAGVLLLSLSPSLGTYRLIFLLAMLPGAIALLLIWAGVREARGVGASRVVESSRGRLPPLFWAFTAATSIAMLTKVNDSLFLLRAGDIGIPIAWIPFLFGGFTLLYALLSYPIGVWTDRVGKLPFLAAGWLVLSVVEFAFALSPGVPTALLLFALYGLFYALTEGSARAFIADSVPSGQRGRAYAVFHTLVGVCVIVGGFGIGRAWETVSPSFAFQIGAVGSLVGGTAFVLMSIRTQKL